jgi:membrane fusion protein, heavy metal efflux system
MKKRLAWIALALGPCFCSSLLILGCNNTQANPGQEAPPPTEVEHEENGVAFQIDHPEQYPLATAGEHQTTPELNATGTVGPDISRNIPVVSIATGRVIALDARLGDTVRKGQLLMRIQSADISQAFSDYQQARADEKLAGVQFARAQLLYSHGAISLNDFQVAQDTEDKAKVTLETAVEHLHVLGADINRPSAVVDVRAPASGVITDQQVATAAGVQGLASPNLFTISDLSHVWVLFDVYENDLSFVRLGEYADIRVAAYPQLLLKGRISNIGSVLDPNLRTAKVRLEVRNPGMLRLGMFVTATFHGLRKQTRATVPADAVLHLHDRDWVFVPAGGKEFRRVGVTAGDMLPDNMQEIVSGIRPGQRVVKNALELQNAVDNE